MRAGRKAGSVAAVVVSFGGIKEGDRFQLEKPALVHSLFLQTNYFGDGLSLPNRKQVIIKETRLWGTRGIRN